MHFNLKNFINDVTFVLQQFVCLYVKIMEFVLRQDSANVQTITMEVAVKMKKRYYLFHIEKVLHLLMFLSIQFIT